MLRVTKVEHEDVFAALGSMCDCCNPEPVTFFGALELGFRIEIGAGLLPSHSLLVQPEQIRESSYTCMICFVPAECEVASDRSGSFVSTWMFCASLVIH